MGELVAAHLTKPKTSGTQPTADMNVSIPTPDDVSNDDESNEYSSRDEQLEQYWSVVDAERAIQNQCVTFDVNVNEDGYSQYKPVADESPLAELGLFYYRKKKELKADLSDDQNLMTYREQFDEPEYGHDRITADNADEFGMSGEQFDDDEVIHFPTDVDLPSDEDGTLQVWAEERPASVNEVVESLKSVTGIGDQMAGQAVNALQRDGILAE